jgi:POT family proton-dependent oligopeptide transporter
MKQPKALYLLNFVSMWECFSYYGMRSILVLYMTHALLFSDSQAFSLYALYTSLLELGGIFGGIIADKLLGLKRTIFLGGWIIVLGHLCLSLPLEESAFYLGLGLIVAGTGLFRSNVAALLGCFYEKNDPRKDAGYTLYYTGINIGGFLASILCGTIGELFGWHYGFGLAALGMLSGNIALFLGSKILERKKEAPKIAAKIKWGSLFGLFLAGPGCALILYHNLTYLFPVAFLAVCYYIYSQLRGSNLDKGRLKLLGIYTILVVIFYGCEEQLGSTLVLFAERHVNRNLFDWKIPASSLITFNPLTILIAGPLLSRLLQNWSCAGITKIAISFLFLGLAFCLLCAGCLSASAEEIVPLWIAIGSIVCIALGELFIGPTVYAAGASAAPDKYQGLTMGIVTLGFAFANLFSGFLSQLMAVVEEDSSLSLYTQGFSWIGWSMLGLAAVLIMTQYKKRIFSS